MINSFSRNYRLIIFTFCGVRYNQRCQILPKITGEGPKILDALGSVENSPKWSIESFQMILNDKLWIFLSYTSPTFSLNAFSILFDQPRLNGPYFLVTYLNHWKSGVLWPFSVVCYALLCLLCLGKLIL